MRLGLIAGTVFYGIDLFGEAEEREIETPYGPALVLVTERVAYLPRHGLDPAKYTLPHRINHLANLAALQELGVKEIIGVHSSGSLRRTLPPGSIVVPEDYISFFDAPTTAFNQALHVAPILSETLRGRLIEAAKKAGIGVHDGGIYWQSRGPRLETRAEVRVIQAFADVVGMTMSDEAVVAQELNLAYASLCSVDNYAHGLAASPLTEEEIRQGAKTNSRKMIAVFNQLLDIGGG